MQGNPDIYKKKHNIMNFQIFYSEVLSNQKNNLTRTYKILKIIYPTDFCNSQLPPN